MCLRFYRSFFFDIHYPSIHLSMALKLFVGPWPLFSFLILYTVGRTPWTEDQCVPRPLYLHTEQYKHRINAGWHPWLSSGTRTHDPNFRASEDSSCHRLRGLCHRLRDSLKRVAIRIPGSQQIYKMLSPTILACRRLKQLRIAYFDLSGCYSNNAMDWLTFTYAIKRCTGKIPESNSRKLCRDISRFTLGFFSPSEYQNSVLHGLRPLRPSPFGSPFVNIRLDTA
jgi:hypothetical protein